MVLDELGVRIGLSYLSISASASAGTATSSASATYLMVPITASYTGIRTRRGAGLELGGGTTLLYTSAAANALGTSSSGSGLTPLVVAMAGFRLQPVDHAGFMYGSVPWRSGAKASACRTPIRRRSASSPGDTSASAPRSERRRH